LNCKIGSENNEGNCVATPQEEYMKGFDCTTFKPWPATLMPPPRGAGSPASTSIGQVVYFFGGEEDELWSFDLASKRWEVILANSDVNPPIRDGCMLKGNPQTGFLYMFGGISPKGRFFNDIWKFDTDKKVWIDLTPDARQVSPNARARMAMAIVRNGQGLIIFGGHTASQLLNDLWYFDFETNEWMSMTTAGESVGPRAAGQFVDFDDESVLLVFGTRYPIASGDKENVYKLIVSGKKSGRWIQPILEADVNWGSPIPRYLSAIVAVPGNRSVVVAMGYSSELHRSLQDVWRLSDVGNNVLRWKRLLPEDPRWQSSSAWQRKRQKLMRGQEQMGYW
jgi:hypothetical protein